MLIEYIERLRKEPKEVRRQAVVVWTTIILVLIVLIYIGVTALGKVFPERGETGSIAAPYEAQ